MRPICVMGSCSFQIANRHVKELCTNRKLTTLHELNEDYLCYSWRHYLQSEFDKSYFSDLRAFLKDDEAKHTIYPSKEHIFSAFNTCPFDKVKVVILGQDPYHQPGQAHGLSFSVRNGVSPPPSLQNIIKMAVNDVGIAMPSSARGNLSSWSSQGVLLLNSVLTVRHGAANSHKGKGWESFTDAAIQSISNNKQNVVYLLWGKDAQKKASLVDASKNLTLTAPHPSPLSAYRGFMECAHFSKTNRYLADHALEPVDWSV